jgi:hypothetical protein
MPVSFREVLDAFEFVSVGGGFGEHQTFLCRQTGKIFWRSELSDFDELEDELPDDIEDGEKYLEIPDKRELDPASRLHWILPARSCRKISTKCGAYSATEALMPVSSNCWLAGVCSTNGTILSKKRRNARCENGGRSIQ